MKSALPCVLTINGGSSSIRFAVYEAGETPRWRLDGKIDRIGLSGTNLTVNDPAGKPQVPRRLAEMREDYTALDGRGIEAAEFLHQIGVRQAVEAVALDALCRVAPRRNFSTW